MNETVEPGAKAALLSLLSSCGIFNTPKRISEPLAWVEHIPFAFFLIEALKPRTLVELGVHTGNSFFAFCQAVKRLGLSTTCRGIDHWGGDDHAGRFENDIYGNVTGYLAEHYADFARFTRSTFNEVLPSFQDSSIDLLHIDGFHTYEAVKHDFEAWFPKLSSRGVVLFHDVTERRDDFGVWRLWEELSQRYPSITFPHCHGLGVLQVGAEVVPELAAVFDDAELSRFCMYLFSRLGFAISSELSLSKNENELASLKGELARLTSRG